MKKEITIDDFSPHLFWDVDLDGFDLQIHKAHLVQKVLEYGLISDWNLIKDLYGLDQIKDISIKIRSLDAVTLSYLSALFNIDKTEFRCYKHRQLYPTYWNS